jgi:hypothetical protein
MILITSADHAAAFVARIAQRAAEAEPPLFPPPPVGEGREEARRKARAEN